MRFIKFFLIVFSTSLFIFFGVDSLDSTGIDYLILPGVITTSLTLNFLFIYLFSKPSNRGDHLNEASDRDLPLSIATFVIGGLLFNYLITIDFQNGSLMERVFRKKNQTLFWVIITYQCIVYPLLKSNLKNMRSIDD